jgi:hypothetical protein
MTSPTPQDTTALVQAVLENATRLGLKWNLIPATVTGINTGSSQVMVLVDGDTLPIGAHSLIGTFDIDTRVMVLIIPGANYVLGLYTDVDVRRSLIFGQTFPASATQVLTGSDTLVPGCTVSFTLTRPAIVAVWVDVDFYERTGPAVVQGIGTIYTDGNPGQSCVSLMRVANDRQMPGTSETNEFAAGDYTVELRVRRDVASGAQEAVGGTTQMTVHIYQ